MNRPNRSRDGQDGRGSQSNRSNAPAGRRHDSTPGGERRSGPSSSGNRPTGRPFGDRPNRDAGGDRPQRPYGDRPQRPSFGGDRDSRPSRPSFGSRDDRPRGDRPERPSFNRDDRPQRPSFNRDDRPARPQYGNRDDRPQRPRDDRPREDRPQRPSYGNRDDRPQGDRPRFDRPQRPSFGGNRDDRPQRPSFNRDDRPQRPSFNRDDRPRDDRPRFNAGDDRPRRDDHDNRDDRPRPERPERPERAPRAEGDRPQRVFESRQQQRPRQANDRAPGSWAGSSRSNDRPQRPGGRNAKGGDQIDRSFAPTGPGENSFTGNAVRRTQEKIRKNAERADLDNKQDKEDDATGEIRLNRYIANAGVCSRREADKLIAEGRITVNGKIQAEMGYKVQKDDQVRLGSKLLSPEKNVYVLLNKPKDYITTKDDEEGRRTVMDLIGTQIRERIYPVGRLDRNTTGLLILTNDGELADKLMHPSFEIKKVYQVDLDRPLSEEDFNTLKRGIELEDGPANVDDIAVLSPDRKSVGLEIHIGRNRIVRRIFEALEYTVVKLDRVMYGGITKKDLPRGKWRFLSQEEVMNLKHYA